MCHAAYMLKSSKNVPSSAQNKVSVDDSPKQGLVGGCPAPLPRRLVEDEF